MQPLKNNKKMRMFPLQLKLLVTLLPFVIFSLLNDKRMYAYEFGLNMKAICEKLIFQFYKIKHNDLKTKYDR